MNRQTFRAPTRFLLVLALSAAWAGCSSEPYRRQELPLQTESSVEITYQLGHHQHRLVVASNGQNVSAQTFSDRSVLEHALVDSAHYEEFYKKTLGFIQTNRNTQRTVASSVTCRSPYIIVVKNGPDSWADNGCRSSDDTGFGRLVRDGEFLLYSKK